MIDQEHITYEFAVLFYSALKIKRGVYDSMQYNIYNVAGYNAGFNLLTYLNTELNEDIPEDITRIHKAIVVQIRTLTSNRTAVMSEKLQTNDMVVLFDYLHSNKDKFGLKNVDGFSFGMFSDLLEGY